MNSDPIDLRSLYRRIEGRENGELLQIRVGVIRRLLRDLEDLAPANVEQNEPLSGPVSAYTDEELAEHHFPPARSQRPPQPREEAHWQDPETGAHYHYFPYRTG